LTTNSREHALQDDTHEDDRAQRARSLRVGRDYLYVVLDCERPLAGGARYSLDQIDEVLIGRGREQRITRETADGRKRLVVLLPGRRLSSVHARIRRVDGAWAVVDAGSTNGSYLNGERVTEAPLTDEDVLELGRTFLMLTRSLEPGDQAPCDREAREVWSRPAAFATLRPEISAGLAAIERVARTDLTLLLCGETGTGKEVLASAIHELSGRSGALIAVNCGAIPDTLVESQLFGHVRGAFSGAHSDALGFVRSAEQGTLLLDEAQDLSPAAQAALLRVLQQREVVPVGSSRPQPVRVRFIATAPQLLDEAVRNGHMRADLLARLQGFTHTLWPLRERPQDLGLLVAAILRRAGVNDAASPSLSLEFAQRLFRYNFPLNVRELEQLLLRAWALSEAGCLDLDFAEPAGELRQSQRAPSELSASDAALRERLLTELRRMRGNVAGVARALGKAPMQVRRWLRRFEIDPEHFRE
jgi:DNA-binding NtrC family response regulator